MNTVHIHLHLPDAESTEKVVPLLKDLLQSEVTITSEHIDKALRRNAGPFSEPDTATAEIEKKLEAMDYKERPAPTTKEPEVQEKPAASSAEVPSREEVYALMNAFIQKGSDNRKKVFNLIKSFEVSSFREVSDDRLGDFVDGLKDLGA